MKYYITLSALILVLFSCHKKDSKIDGPSLEDLNGQFSVLSPLAASIDSVDFASGETVYFTALFSKTSEWNLKVTGLVSGAVKTMTGTSNELNASSSLWSGETTNLPIFKNENCKVELTFPNETDTLITYVKVLQAKVNSGFLISDFENGFNSGWTSFIQSGANMNFQVLSDASSPQGNKYYNMAGTVNWDWLIGLVNFKSTAYGGAPAFPLNANPNSVYFNVMIYGESGTTNSIVLFQFEEDENGDGIFTAASEDMYAKEIKVDWAGWKLISVKYSDIESLVNGVPATPNGNGTHDSNKIKTINMLHLANPNSGFAKSKLDYIIFTENGPLVP